MIKPPKTINVLKFGSKRFDAEVIKMTFLYITVQKIRDQITRDRCQMLMQSLLVEGDPNFEEYLQSLPLCSTRCI